MRNDYLQRMGVTVWRSRVKQNARYFCCVLQNAALKPVGLILADIADTVSVVEQENLLRKIAGALTDNIIIEHGVLSDAVSFSFVILLGDVTRLERFVNSNRIIKSSSLSDLLCNVEHKKLLWAEMKLLKEFFNV